MGTERVNVQGQGDGWQPCGLPCGLGHDAEVTVVSVAVSCSQPPEAARGQVQGGQRSNSPAVLSFHARVTKQVRDKGGIDIIYHGI